MPTITRATLDGIPVLVKLVNSAYRGETSKQGWTTEADLLDGIRTDEASMREMLIKKDAVILKYKNDKNELTGCVYLEKKDNDLYLGMLSVSPAEQAKGIGKKLIQSAEEYGMQHRYDKIVMTVISVRKELLLWYNRHGYEQTDKTQPFPSDTKFGIPKQPLEFVILEKKL